MRFKCVMTVISLPWVGCDISVCALWVAVVDRFRYFTFCQFLFSSFLFYLFCCFVSVNKRLFYYNYFVFQGNRLVDCLRMEIEGGVCFFCRMDSCVVTFFFFITEKLIAIEGDDAFARFCSLCFGELSSSPRSSVKIVNLIDEITLSTYKIYYS